MYQEHLYKEQLYHTLANDNNLVDNVKLQLRQKIINKLKLTQGTQSKKIQTDQDLVKKVCVSLFVEYLNQARLFHTLAVFSPESGFSRNLFNSQQLSQLFRMNTKNDESSLQNVIKTLLPSGRLYEKTAEISVQTDDKETIQNLQNKLAHIDFQYKQKAIEGLKSIESSQQRFVKYKNDLHKRYQTDLEQQIKRIRDFEITKIRIEQQQRTKIHQKQYEQQLQLAYRQKLQKLRQRQGQVMKRVASKMKQVQKHNYDTRQSILRDMEMVKAREQQLQRLKQQILQKQRRLIRQT